MTPSWFFTRGYKHFDAPVSLAHAECLVEVSSIRTHAWSPLISYIKRVKRYKRPDPTKAGKTVYKDRDIMYASHRDACILTKYAYELSQKLDDCYVAAGLSGNVIGYRKLGKANYHFSADAFRFAVERAPCAVRCFDITGFFDHMDHQLLKGSLKQILGVSELPDDWYRVFRHVTRFSHVSREKITEVPKFALRMKSRKSGPVATISEIKAAGIPILTNNNKFGIPQGTPISSALSNLYLFNLDKRVAAVCDKLGGLYQRYSDDILVICKPDDAKFIEDYLVSEILECKLEIKNEKTVRSIFDAAAPDNFQYLGFDVTPSGATIRQSSLARQWRKFKYSLNKTRKIGAAAVSEGRSSKIYTKRLRRRFCPVGVRNFSAYSRRASKEFGSSQIARQVARLERKADQEIRDLNV